ncbi:MAG: HTH domain-containing protein [Chloroflexota bacterium]|nr:HTH domain-containing protein [Chloroflexota bacterium]
MFIPPKRRRRIMRAHHLRQQGHSLRQIAEKLNISVATVRADLKLAQTHWATIAAASADDLLLESLHLLQARLTRAIKNDDVSRNAGRLTPVDYLRARDAQETQLNHLAREIRRTAHDVHRRAAQRPDQPDLFDEEPQELAETITESTKIEPPNSTISSPEQEIVQSQPSEEKIPTQPIRPPVELSRPSRNGAKPSPIQTPAAG